MRRIILREKSVVADEGIYNNMFNRREIKWVLSNNVFTV